MDGSTMLRSKDAYVKAALFGLAIYFVAAIIILIAILVFSPSDVGFALFLIIPGLIAVAALLYIRRWGLLIGALLSAFGVFAFIGDAGLVLASPEAFLDFLLTLFALSGLGISFFACLIGFIQYFRGPVANDVALGITMTLRGIAAAVVIAALVSLVLTVINATETVSAEDKQGALELTADDTKWSANTLDTRAGQPVRILVKNDDPILHTFTMKDKGRGVDTDIHLGPWSEQIVDLGTLQAGIYGYICRVEGHEEDMTGALTIR
jgi:uncharacterized cupredoxin-like copper-binding protein